MPATWSPNAVRAQSVAARTYGVRQKATPLTRTYHICDTTACQVYGGVEAEHSASNAAVQATKSQVLTSDGKPAFTHFSTRSGGWPADTPGSPYFIPSPERTGTRKGKSDAERVKLWGTHINKQKKKK